MSTVHIHIDESGDFNFTREGSRYYIFTAVWTYSPQSLSEALSRLRYNLNKDGADLARFHAHRDRQIHRDQVVATMLAHSNWRFASILVEKRKVYPAIREAHVFYPKFLNSILLFVFRGALVANTSRILIYTDRVPADANKKAVNASIRDLGERELNGTPFHVMHHSGESNPWLQVADYCSWTICRKWERDDPRTYDRLKARLAAPERDALRSGLKLYY